MPPIHVLIKPASGSCNLRCEYCFYTDEASKRETASFGMMSPETLEAVVKRVLSFATGECTIAFQGGEPTLVGLDFYRQLVELQKKYNSKGLKILNAMQTNGIAIDHEWARFFAENNFLIGLSLDGSKDINDQLRIDPSGEGTYKRIMRTAQLFDNYKVEYNILTVVTAQVAKNIGKIMGFFKRNNLRYQQYIPCLDPLYEERGRYSFSLTPELYGRFLKRSFDAWYNDVKKGEFIYNRYFENLIGMLLGYYPESCGMSGQCSYQYVVEADGGVFPCDFYVLDQYKLGNLVEDDFESIDKKRKEIGFIEESLIVEEKCKSCKWFKLCRGGCRRYRDNLGKVELNYYCSSYQDFFEYSIERLLEIARGIKSNEVKK